MSLLRKEAERAKITLSDGDLKQELKQVHVIVDSLDLRHDFETKISRDSLGAACKANFDRAVQCVKDALVMAKLQPREIREVCSEKKHQDYGYCCLSRCYLWVAPRESQPFARD